MKSINVLQTALTNEHIELSREEFLDMHTYDQAQFFIEQEHELSFQIYYYLSPIEIARVMMNIDLEDTKSFIIEMEPQFAANVFANMPADDAVDILNELDKDKVASFLTIMNPEAAEEIKDLLHYEEKTAGSIMTTEFVAVLKNETVREAMRRLKIIAPKAETIYYLYVLTDDNHLAGVLSLRDLIIADDDTLIEQVMDENVVSVSVK